MSKITISHDIEFQEEFVDQVGVPGDAFSLLRSAAAAFLSFVIWERLYCATESGQPVFRRP